MLAMQHPYVVVAPAETMHVEAWAGTGKPVAVIPGLFGASFTFLDLRGNVLPSATGARVGQAFASLRF